MLRNVLEKMTFDDGGDNDVNETTPLSIESNGHAAESPAPVPLNPNVLLRNHITTGGSNGNGNDDDDELTITPLDDDGATSSDDDDDDAEENRVRLKKNVERYESICTEPLDIFVVGLDDERRFLVSQLLCRELGATYVPPVDHAALWIDDTTSRETFVGIDKKNTDENWHTLHPNLAQMIAENPRRWWYHALTHHATQSFFNYASFSNPASRYHVINGSIRDSLDVYSEYARKNSFIDPFELALFQRQTVRLIASVAKKERVFRPFRLFVFLDQPDAGVDEYLRCVEQRRIAASAKIFSTSAATASSTSTKQSSVYDRVEAQRPLPAGPDEVRRMAECYRLAYMQKGSSTTPLAGVLLVDSFFALSGIQEASMLQKLIENISQMMLARQRRLIREFHLEAIDAMQPAPMRRFPLTALAVTPTRTHVFDAISTAELGLMNAASLLADSDDEDAEQKKATDGKLD
jgi:hypothetical protein